jgi:phosphatidylserine/phosphatidylglycerophosphate/cardiolipin synthase-like enzyme
MEKALIKLINSATQSIDLAIYSFDRKSILNALLKAKARGVKIRVITEKDIYNNPCYRITYRTLKKAGIPLKLDNNVNEYENLMHHKFIVIDKHLIWTGSCNLTNSGFEWNANDAILIDSTDLAKAYIEEFEEMFVHNKWGKDKSDTNEELFDVDGTLVELYTSPQDNLEKRIIEIIDKARDSIYLVMFYLTNDNIYWALRRAISRGVKVKGIFDERGVSNNFAEALDLIKTKNGVVDALAGLAHHKFAIVDKDSAEPVVITGSANWSYSGTRYNDENTLIIHDPKVARTFFTHWQKLYYDATFAYPHSADTDPPGPPRVTYHHYNSQPNHTRIEWNTSQIAATSYNIYRSVRRGGPYKLLVNISKKKALESSDYQKREEKDGIEGSYYAHYDDYAVEKGKTYYYVVTTLVGKKESDYSNEYVEEVK